MTLEWREIPETAARTPKPPCNHVQRERRRFFEVARRNHGSLRCDLIVDPDENQRSPGEIAAFSGAAMEPRRRAFKAQMRKLFNLLLRDLFTPSIRSNSAAGLFQSPVSEFHRHGAV